MKIKYLQLFFIKNMCKGPTFSQPIICLQTSLNLLHSKKKPTNAFNSFQLKRKRKKKIKRKSIEKTVKK